MKKFFICKLSVFGLVLLTQACGETVNFDTEEKLADTPSAPNGDDAVKVPEGSETPDGSKTGTGIGTDGIPLACHGDQVIAMEKALEFPEIPLGTTCAFGQGDNLSRVNGKVQAYLKQSASVQLPEGAKLCGFSLEHEAAAMRYDDEMFFFVNDRLLLATQDYTEFFTRNDDFFSFNWSSLKTQNYDPSNPRGVYCAGGSEGLSSCSVPPTETSGKIKLTFSETMETTLARVLQQDRSLNFDWITTGDNDDSDCRHTAITLKLKLRYVN